MVGTENEEVDFTSTKNLVVIRGLSTVFNVTFYKDGQPRAYTFTLKFGDCVAYRKLPRIVHSNPATIDKPQLLPLMSWDSYPIVDNIINVEPLEEDAHEYKDFVDIFCGRFFKCLEFEDAENELKSMIFKIMQRYMFADHKLKSSEIIHSKEVSIGVIGTSFDIDLRTEIILQPHYTEFEKNLICGYNIYDIYAHLGVKPIDENDPQLALNF